MPDNADSTTDMRWTLRQVVLATLFVAGLLLSAALLYRFRLVALMLFVAVLVGTALKPAVSFLAARGIPHIYGELLIYGVVLLVFVGFVVLVLPPFLQQANAVTGLAREYYNETRQALVNSQSRIVRNVGLQLPANPDLLGLTSAPAAAAPGDDAEDRSAEEIALALSTVGTVARGIFFLVATSLLAFYWTLESERAIRTLLMLFSPARRETAREIIDAVEDKLGAYLFGMGILLLSIFGLSLVAYVLIGLPNALVLALIAGVMEAVPTIGPILGAIPAVLVAASADPSKIIWVLVATMIIQVAENNLLVPRVMDRSVGVNPLLTILAIAALSSLMGLAGALLAVPTAAILQLLFDRFVMAPVREPTLKPEGRGYVSYLRLQVQEVALDSRNQIMEAAADSPGQATEERVEELIESLANDLDRILAQLPPTEDNGV